MFANCLLKIDETVWVTKQEERVVVIQYYNNLRLNNEWRLIIYSSSLILNLDMKLVWLLAVGDTLGVGLSDTYQYTKDEKIWCSFIICNFIAYCPHKVWLHTSVYF